MVFKPSPRLWVTSLSLRPPIYSKSILPSHRMVFEPKDRRALNCPLRSNTPLWSPFTSVRSPGRPAAAGTRGPQPEPARRRTGESCTSVVVFLKKIHKRLFIRIFQSSQTVVKLRLRRLFPPSKGNSLQGKGICCFVGDFLSFMAKTFSSLHGVAWYSPA